MSYLLTCCRDIRLELKENERGCTDNESSAVEQLEQLTNAELRGQVNACERYVCVVCSCVKES